MAHAFISYVREDSTEVDRLARIIRSNGIEVWLDRDSIDAGTRWMSKIRQAIQSGDFFIAAFSRAWAARARTTANEELTLAIDELRRRPTDRTWFIPLRIDECSLPERTISGTEQLSDIERVDFPDLGWTRAVEKLLRALEVENPSLDIEPQAGTFAPDVSVGGQSDNTQPTRTTNESRLEYGKFKGRITEKGNYVLEGVVRIIPSHGRASIWIQAVGPTVRRLVLNLAETGTVSNYSERYGEGIASVSLDDAKGLFYIKVVMVSEGSVQIMYRFT